MNAVANFCFLTQDTNLRVGRREPEDYFAEAEAKFPGALASQWIPTDPELWRPDRYHEYGGVETARRLLRSPTVSDGFAALWERGRLDLTVEAVVIDPRFARLFSEAEVNRARSRLEQFGYVA